MLTRCVSFDAALTGPYCANRQPYLNLEKGEMVSGSKNTKVYLTVAGALFEALAAYSVFHEKADWLQAILWAAIGATFIALGLAQTKDDQRR